MKYLLALVFAVCVAQALAGTYGRYDDYKRERKPNRAYDDYRYRSRSYGNKYSTDRYDDGYGRYGASNYELGYDNDDYDKTNYYHKRRDFEKVWVQNTNKNDNDNKEKSRNENESDNLDLNVNSLIEAIIKKQAGYGVDDGYGKH